MSDTEIDHHILFLIQKSTKTTPKTIATGAHFRIRAYTKYFILNYLSTIQNITRTQT